MEKERRRKKALLVLPCWRVRRAECLWVGEWMGAAGCCAKMLSTRHSKVRTSLPLWHQYPQSGLMRDNALMEIDEGGWGGGVSEIRQYKAHWWRETGW